MNRDQYLKAWLVYHRGYERRAFSIFNAAIKKAARNIPFENLTEENYPAQIAINIPIDLIYNAYFNVYNVVGKSHGRRVGSAINMELKDFTIDSFMEAFNRNLSNWITQNLGQSIVTVRKSLISTIVELMRTRLESGLTVEEASKQIRDLVNRRNFYRWQALRIARTESTSAANYGASIAGSTSGIVLEKMWISVNDVRTRPSSGDETPYNHRLMNGVRVGENENFQTPNDRPLRFPGDPLAAGGNRINCRCAMAMVPKRDSQGRIMVKV